MHVMRVADPNSRPFRPAWLLVPLTLSVLALAGAGCGKLMTTAPEPADLFDSPLEGLTPAELSSFVEGDAQFGRPFAITEGLGPIFNNVSCASCHSGDGRGRPENVLTRFSLGGD